MFTTDDCLSTNQTSLDKILVFKTLGLVLAWMNFMIALEKFQEKRSK